MNDKQVSFLLAFMLQLSCVHCEVGFHRALLLRAQCMHVCSRTHTHRVQMVIIVNFLAPYVTSVASSALVVLKGYLVVSVSECAKRTPQLLFDGCG